jgi:SAM-dependent methyltransferase
LNVNAANARFSSNTFRSALATARDLAVRYVERRNGINTADPVDLTNIGHAAPDRSSYKAAPWFALRRSLGPTVSSDDVFLDLGSGRGRVVFQAAKHYRFRRVIGVELVPELHETAVLNIERNRGTLRCRDVRLICSDALEFSIPDDVTVVYLYNPFVGDTFAKVMDRLVASYDSRPRLIRLVYTNPVEHERLVAMRRFRVVRKVRALRPNADWARSASTYTYEVVPQW